MGLFSYEAQKTSKCGKNILAAFLVLADCNDVTLNNAWS